MLKDPRKGLAGAVVAMVVAMVVPMVIAMVIPAVVAVVIPAIIPVVVVVVFPGPVPLVHMPSVGVVIPMGVDIVGAFVWWPVPDAGVPAIPALKWLPVPFGPGIARARCRGTSFIAKRRWGLTNSDSERDLGLSCGCGERERHDSGGGDSELDQRCALLHRLDLSEVREAIGQGGCTYRGRLSSEAGTGHQQRVQRDVFEEVEFQAEGQQPAHRGRAPDVLAGGAKRG